MTTPRSITVELPYPPSANRLWRAVNGRQIKSGHYRLWLSEAAWKLHSQLPGFRTVDGPYRLLIEATAPDRRKRDLDNLIKPLSDALRNADVVADDSNCRALNVLWVNGVTPGGHIKVIVTEVDDERRAA